MKVLVLGAGGMLGSAMVSVLAGQQEMDVSGTLRNTAISEDFTTMAAARLFAGIDALDENALVDVLARVRPDVVINCIGVVKQLREADDPLIAIPVNAVLPHRLARLCKLASARLIHFSTDCVFSGSKGNYAESDQSDATDLYGRSKYLGELHQPHTITLRTSVIGHELRSRNSLIGWFLAQQGRCPGFTGAVFSGLPAVVLAQIVRDVIIPRPDLYGLYHVASDPISKFDLLELVARVYGKVIEIDRYNAPVIDRSLNARRFQDATGYRAPDWPELVSVMHTYYCGTANRQDVQR
jgi:dTDP-4-dehydrorhamnose reductase